MTDKATSRCLDANWRTDGEYLGWACGLKVLGEGIRYASLVKIPAVVSRNGPDDGLMPMMP